VRPEDCINDKYGYANCSAARGGVFETGKSKTWTNNGDNDVDPVGNGIFKRRFTFGTDTVGIGVKPLASKMTNQTVALMHNPSSSYLGTVGISPVPVNYTDDHRVTQTFFEGLRGTTRIASRTVSYTAGIWSREHIHRH
jgi:hypothetical protein